MTPVRDLFFAIITLPLTAAFANMTFLQGSNYHIWCLSCLFFVPFYVKERLLNMDLSIFATPEAWISLVTLIFLEIILGVDNIVFITITTDKLKESQQHIGRKLGLAGALISRIIFLSVASYLVHMTTALFTFDLGFYAHGFSIRDIVLLLGGIYLLYKGIAELRSLIKLTELRQAHQAQKGEEGAHAHTISLPQAVATIMVMDVVFSIDSVITAVGLAEHLIIMIVAVMTAVFLMMIFIDAVSDFINKHYEMKILALSFITVIGILLIVDAVGFHTGIEVLGMGLEKFMVYFAMVFSVIVVFIQLAYKKNYEKFMAEVNNGAGVAVGNAGEAAEVEAEAE